MLSKLLNKYKNSKDFIAYFILTYVDKIISFALPLSILFIIKDKALYTFVEVAFSYATLAMVVVDLGFSSYLFYGYKKSENKEAFLVNAKIFFKFTLLSYCLLLLPCLLLINNYNKEFFTLFCIISLRTLFTFFTTFYSNIFRLNDNPSGIYLTTIIVNLLSFILLLLANYFSFQGKLIYFLLPSLFLIVWICGKFVLFELKKLHFRAFFSFLKESLTFSWPIILNVLAMSYMNNYAKIYAYGHLSIEETLQVSYILRVGLIIQLTHASFASFFSKTLFMDEVKRLNLNIFKKYSLVLFLSTVFVGIIILATNFLFNEQIHIPFAISTALFIFYIVLWCFIGYLEIYFGIMNANRRILYYSILSVGIYTILLSLFGNVTILTLSICMVISALINLSLVIFGLYKLHVIGTIITSNKLKI